MREKNIETDEEMLIAVTITSIVVIVTAYFMYTNIGSESDSLTIQTFYKSFFIFKITKLRIVATNG